ncbi:tRNA modification GTPase MnmE [Usitatibacter rugosus]|uniref:tRNA modification GTPase MnmE n=1 Tax=Usitatibacter rugosus TaxID=2732067 RepID=A0A6M4H3Z8_9PROT|nr:tRNA modification GTPase MnmE [Usitatibacter rugosus]
MAYQPHPRARVEGQSAPLSAGADTIAAVATPAGRGGIGVVRVSGARVREIAGGVLGALPEPRHATLADFRTAQGAPIDSGIALFFPAPRSYTGEDVLELQGHGGPVVMRELLRRCVALGARVAEPGEFTRRAFLNDRIDLAQAESVADLIDASSTEAAASAARSLAGEFSQRITSLVAALTELRMHVEACIDFPEEEIDPADRKALDEKLSAIRVAHAVLLDAARQGAVLREGLTVALVGRPNVGKSSLLNRLAGEDVAIVTPIAGTTRDYVRATIELEGVPIHLIDTAGLRDAAADEVERIGIERTWAAAASAGAVLYITEEGEQPRVEDASLLARLPAGIPKAHVFNKIDLSRSTASTSAAGKDAEIHLSAKTGDGVAALRSWLLETAGWRPHGEGLFMARERHLVALRVAGERLASAERNTQAFELFAEDLKITQDALGQITGAVSADDLLGEIFSRFCIGK